MKFQDTRACSIIRGPMEKVSFPCPEYIVGGDISQTNMPFLAVSSGSSMVEHGVVMTRGASHTRVGDSGRAELVDLLGTRGHGGGSPAWRHGPVAAAIECAVHHASAGTVKNQISSRIILPAKSMDVQIDVYCIAGYTLQQLSRAANGCQVRPGEFQAIRQPHTLQMHRLSAMMAPVQAPS